ncbi:hypothetical protein NECID01_0983 [Nematocida sp. AWRm77]|nr:hypothetical protein NECID01_0983 [Nematocida sp. AWRm77]
MNRLDKHASKEKPMKTLKYNKELIVRELKARLQTHRNDIMSQLFLDEFKETLTETVFESLPMCIKERRMKAFLHMYLYCCASTHIEDRANLSAQKKDALKMKLLDTTDDVYNSVCILMQNTTQESHNTDQEIKSLIENKAKEVATAKTLGSTELRVADELAKLKYVDSSNIQKSIRDNDELYCLYLENLLSLYNIETLIQTRTKSWFFSDKKDTLARINAMKRQTRICSYAVFEDMASIRIDLIMQRKKTLLGFNPTLETYAEVINANRKYSYGLEALKRYLEQCYFKAYIKEYWLLSPANIEFYANNMFTILYRYMHLAMIVTALYVSSMIPKLVLLLRREIITGSLNSKAWLTYLIFMAGVVLGSRCLYLVTFNLFPVFPCTGQIKETEIRGISMLLIYTEFVSFLFASFVVVLICRNPKGVDVILEPLDKIGLEDRKQLCLLFFLLGNIRTLLFVIKHAIVHKLYGFSWFSTRHWKKHLSISYPSIFFFVLSLGFLCAGFYIYNVTPKEVFEFVTNMQIYENPIPDSKRESHRV